MSARLCDPRVKGVDSADRGLASALFMFRGRKVANLKFVRRRAGVVGFGLLAATGIALMPALGAQAATEISGPVDLGTAATYGALGASAVTNTGPTVINGDLGVSPGTSVTGFGVGLGTFTGTLHQTDAAAAQAQADTTTAFNTAASITPTESGISELSGLSLSPGVYAGGALALANGGSLTLAGSANSVWVFQAASTLTIGSGSHILITGGASSCNVFWEVGSSATIGTTAQFQGTVMAMQSITATTGATIQGRLLARTAGVTLDSNVVTPPSGCEPAGSVFTSPSPEITSESPTGATAGTPYSFVLTASGTPSPTFAITGGTLPAGLQINGSTGTISGTPTSPGNSTFTITASNGIAPATSAIYTITTAAPPATTPASTPPPAAVATGPAAAPKLAKTGSNPTFPLYVGSLLLGVGVTILALKRTLPPRQDPKKIH